MQDRVSGMFKAFFGKSMLQRDGKYIKFIRDKAAFGFQELSQELETWLKPENTLLNSFCLAITGRSREFMPGNTWRRTACFMIIKRFASAVCRTISV